MPKVVSLSAERLRRALASGEKPPSVVVWAEDDAVCVELGDGNVATLSVEAAEELAAILLECAADARERSGPCG